VRNTWLDFASSFRNTFGTARHLLESIQGSHADSKNLCGVADIPKKMTWAFSRLNAVCLMIVMESCKIACRDLRLIRQQLSSAESQKQTIEVQRIGSHI